MTLDFSKMSVSWKGTKNEREKEWKEKEMQERAVSLLQINSLKSQNK